MFLLEARQSFSWFRHGRLKWKPSGSRKLFWAHDFLPFRRLNRKRKPRQDLCSCRTDHSGVCWNEKLWLKHEFKARFMDSKYRYPDKTFFTVKNYYSFEVGTILIIKEDIYFHGNWFNIHVNILAFEANWSTKILLWWFLQHKGCGLHDRVLTAGLEPTFGVVEDWVRALEVLQHELLLARALLNQLLNLRVKKYEKNEARINAQSYITFLATTSLQNTQNSVWPEG